MNSLFKRQSDYSGVDRLMGVTIPADPDEQHVAVLNHAKSGGVALRSSFTDGQGEEAAPAAGADFAKQSVRSVTYSDPGCSTPRSVHQRTTSGNPRVRRTSVLQPASPRMMPTSRFGPAADGRRMMGDEEKDYEGPGMFFLTSGHAPR